MFSKLFKYEWKKTYLPCTLICLLFVVLTGIGCFSVLVGNYEKLLAEDKTGLASIFMTLYFMAYFFVGMTMMVVIPYFFFYRYYKNLYTDQGYLMHTLPVSKKSLLWTKLLVAVIWQVITPIVLFGCMILFVMCATMELPEMLGIDWGEFSREFGEAFGEIGITLSESGVKYIPAIIAGILSFLIMPFQRYLFFYVAIGIGQLFKKYKLVMSFIILYLMNLAMNFIGRILSLPLIIAGNREPEALTINIIFVVGFLLLAGLTVGEYFLNVYFLEKKVNLE
ncbi:MAG: hypothetical protein K6G07_01395 [Lachnospiraceae bacterium]|nr:hypothetical protein [Lachnospiraceae bacterium]